MLASNKLLPTGKVPVQSRYKVLKDIVSEWKNAAV